MVSESINREDVVGLGKKLAGLKGLKPKERALLWTALSVAADALSPEGAKLDRVALVDGQGELMVELNAEDATLLNVAKDLPDRMANAFLPGSLPAEEVDRGKITKGRKITGSVESWF